MSPSTGGVHRAHRTEDGHHIRDAVHVVPDEKAEASERVLSRLADGTFDNRRERRRVGPALPDAEALSAPREDTTGAFERRGVGSGTVQIGPTVPAPPPVRDPRDRWEQEDAAQVHRRLRKSLLVPGALRLACSAHDAGVDVPCWGRAGQPGSGVCMPRIMRGKVAAALPSPVRETADWHRRQAERQRSSEHLRVRATDKATEPWPMGERRRNRSWPPREDAR